MASFEWMVKNSSQICGKNWKKLAQEHIAIKKDIEDMRYQLGKVRARMLDLSGGEDVYGHGVLIFHQKHKGLVDLEKLEKALKEIKIDIDDYRVKRQRKPYFYILHWKRGEFEEE